MQSVTDYILSKTHRLGAQPEVSPGGQEWSMFNDAGTEIEVSEFLYSLVRMVKPNYILETGTHLGISACYMALALAQNRRGLMTTYEIIDVLRQGAIGLWKDVGINHLIETKLMSSLTEFNNDRTIDLLFLDSEPQLRFDEFVKYWPQVAPAGFILIHDFHPSMGHSGQVINNQYDWPYGDFRVKLGPYITSLQVQTINFKTPRGLTLFQKTGPGFENTLYLQSKLMLRPE